MVLCVCQWYWLDPFVHSIHPHHTSPVDTNTHQVENCRGMAVALVDIFPNATHGEFVRVMQPALLDLARECRVVLEGVRGFGSMHRPVHLSIYQCCVHQMD